MGNAIDMLSDELVANAGPKLVAHVVKEFGKHLQQAENRIMTVRQAAAHTGLSQTKIRDLVTAGLLKRAPGFAEIRIRQSVLDAYGK